MPIRRRSFIPMISQNIHAIYSVPTYILAKCVPWTLANLCTYIFTEKNTHLLWNGELSLYGWPDVRLVWIQYLCLLTFKSTYLPIMSKPLKQEAICTVIGTSPFKFKEYSVIFLWISTIIWFRITQSIVYALLYWDSSILRWNMVNDLLQQTRHGRDISRGIISRQKSGRVGSRSRSGRPPQFFKKSGSGRP